jgi:hypothetical protein
MDIGELVALWLWELDKGQNLGMGENWNLQIKDYYIEIFTNLIPLNLSGHLDWSPEKWKEKERDGTNWRIKFLVSYFVGLGKWTWIKDKTWEWAKIGIKQPEILLILFPSAAKVLGTIFEWKVETKFAHLNTQIGEWKFLKRGNEFCELFCAFSN